MIQRFRSIAGFGDCEIKFFDQKTRDLPDQRAIVDNEAMAHENSVHFAHLHDAAK
jgi:hypothetical protein